MLSAGAEKRYVRSSRREVIDAAPVGLAFASEPLRVAADEPPGRALFQQQCWSWGRDVQHEGGNLLLEYGFQKTSAPKLEWGSSCYTFANTPLTTIRLWGFGVLHCDVRYGAIFLQRSAFEPKLVGANASVAAVWRPEQIGRMRTPRLPADRDAVLALLPPLLAWIGAYEQWVLDTYGAAYRRDTLRGWEASIVAAEHVPAEWWAMASAWREQLSGERASD